MKSDNPPAVVHGWTLRGIVRKHGKTYALAWQNGMTSACNERGDLLSLTALERSRVTNAVLFDKAPGGETVPKYERPPGPSLFTWR